MRWVVTVAAAIVVFLETVSFGGWLVVPLTVGLALVWPMAPALAAGFSYGLLGAMVAGETWGPRAIYLLAVVVVTRLVVKRLPGQGLVVIGLGVGWYGVERLVWGGLWRWGELVVGVVWLVLITKVLRIMEERSNEGQIWTSV